MDALRVVNCWIASSALETPVSGAVLFGIFVVGCGPHSDRLEVSGKVMLNGEPLDGGSIRFTSQATRNLPAARWSTTADTRFREKGSIAGDVSRGTQCPDESVPPVMVRPPGGGPGSLAAPERIPSEYNDNSQHTIEVTADGDNQFNFDIVNKPAK